MKIKEPSRDIDVVHETDVLVVESGPGGLAAAIGAARAGVSVSLLECFGCFGGNITAVGVEGFAWYRHVDTVDTEGVGIEFEERAKAMGAATPEPQSDSHALDAEGFKCVADALVEEAGITPMLHRLCVAPIMDGNKITGVITESKAVSGREGKLFRFNRNVVSSINLPIFSEREINLLLYKLNSLRLSKLSNISSRKRFLSKDRSNKPSKYTLFMFLVDL